LSDYARIFLLSHMRAYTSLAGHILGSHPQINGYYEMHISYEDASALDRQLEMFRQGMNSATVFLRAKEPPYIVTVYFVRTAGGKR
jgi:hypothetical protein